jgi:hypothetical protein
MAGLGGVDGFVRLPLKRIAQQGLQKLADIKEGPVF